MLLSCDGSTMKEIR